MWHWSTARRPSTVVDTSVRADATTSAFQQSVRLRTCGQIPLTLQPGPKLAGDRATEPLPPRSMHQARASVRADDTATALYSSDVPIASDCDNVAVRKLVVLLLSEPSQAVFISVSKSNALWRFVP